MAEAEITVIRLPAKAGLAEAEALLATLREYDPEEPLRMDASGVDQLSTPFVLTLISAINTRTKAEPPATVVNPSPAFVDAFTDLGLFQDLMKMEFAS
ncbi:MAG: STAS domain-containing protein [Pseudomonadota bacterium]